MPRLSPKSSALAACLLAFLALLLFAPQAHSNEELEDAMEHMERPYKQLKKHLKNPAERESCLKWIAEFQKYALQSKAVLPESIGDLPPEQRQKASDAYRTMMVNLLRATLDIEQALIEKDFDTAAKEFLTLEKLDIEGHKEFRKKL